jgi:hypothetical protein
LIADEPPASHNQGEKMKRLRRPAKTKLGSLGSGMLVGVVLIGGVLSGCGGGGSDTESAGQGAKSEIETGVQNVEKGVRKGTQEAEELIQEAKEKFESGEGSVKAREGLKQLEHGIKQGKVQGEAAVEEAKKKINELTK